MDGEWCNKLQYFNRSNRHFIILPTPIHITDKIRFCCSSAVHWNENIFSHTIRRLYGGIYARFQINQKQIVCWLWRIGFFASHVAVHMVWYNYFRIVILRSWPIPSFGMLNAYKQTKVMHLIFIGNHKLWFASNSVNFNCYWYSAIQLNIITAHNQYTRNWLHLVENLFMHVHRISCDHILQNILRFKHICETN